MSDAAPPPLTRDEVDEVAKSVASVLFDDPSQAGMIAAVMARRMNAAKTREAQDKAGASVLRLFVSLADEALTPDSRP